jgi:O-antigen/teichoic acid export membrane protein
MNTGASVNVQQEVETAEPSVAIPLHQQPGLRGRVLQNTAANIVGRGLAIVFSTGAAVLLARFLGAEKLGQYGAIYAYLALFGWLATFGFEPVLVREISRERENASNLVRTAMVLSAFLSIGTVAAAVLVAPWAGYTGHLRTLLILAGLEYVLTPLRLPAVIFQVDMRQWYGATMNVVRQGLWFGIIVLLWLLGAPLAYVIAGRVLVAAIESWLMWRYGRRSLARRGRFLVDRAGMIFSHSFPIAFTALLTMIYLRIDQVMLHKMVNDSVLGQYVAAVKVSELFEMLPSALMFAIAPILSVSVVDPQRFRSYTDRAFRYVMVVASGLCVSMSVGARLVVHLLYGAQFSPAAPLLAVLIWSEIAIFFAAVVVNVLIVSNQQRWLPVPTLAGAAINIGLNLVLIPRYAAAGAAWATLISYTLAWMVAFLFFKETRSVMWQGLRFALPIAAMALLATECGTLAAGPSVGKLFVSLVMFAGGVFATKCLRVSDLSYMLVLVRESVKKVSS